MFELIDIENLQFWSSYYYSMFAPFVNLFISIAFNTIVIKEIYKIIRNKFDKQIKIVYIMTNKERKVYRQNKIK